MPRPTLPGRRESSWQRTGTAKLLPSCRQSRKSAVIDGQTRAHRAGQGQFLEIDTLGRARLETLEVVDQCFEVALERVGRQVAHLHVAVLEQLLHGGPKRASRQCKIIAAKAVYRECVYSGPIVGQ